MVRKPVVAGMFYPENQDELEAFIKKEMQPAGVEEPVLGLVAPHAGYVYSGGVAARTYARARVPSRVVILSPNHTGIGRAAAIAPHQAWETPLGKVEVDLELAAQLEEASSYLSFDKAAHLREHSVEVQVPFLQMKRPDVRIVPITLMNLSFPIVRQIGEDLAGALKGQEVLIVASSDMNHYEPQSIANRKDRIALDRVLAMDPEGLYRAIHDHGISMCGYIPTSIMLIATMAMGATKAELVDYRTSGDVTGDYSSVVGYAGVIVK